MNLQELMNRIGEIIPNATLGEDADGQIVAYTNLRATINGALIDMDAHVVEQIGDEYGCPICCEASFANMWDLENHMDYCS